MLRYNNEKADLHVHEFQFIYSISIFCIRVHFTHLFHQMRYRQKIPKRDQCDGSNTSKYKKSMA